MDDDRVTIQIAISGCSEETAKALHGLVNAALEWRIALDEGGELTATDRLVEAIEDFVECVGDEPGLEGEEPTE